MLLTHGNVTFRRFAKVLIALAIALAAMALAVMLQAPAADAQAGPLPPTSCSVSWSGQTATITWSPANNDGANRYVLERNVNGGNWQWTDRINLGEPLSSTYVAASGDTVIFRIKSRDSADANSSYVSCDPAGGALLAPTSCSFTRVGNTATITWTAANNDGANRYVIERNRNNLGWSWAARINVGNPLTSSNSVDAADSVQFRVKSRNAADDNSSYTTCTQGDSGQLLAPVSCSFTRTGNTATITWTAANNDGANRYVIERNRNNLGWFWADRIDLGEPLVSTNSVDAADSVQFRVKSRNAADDNSSYTTCTQGDSGQLLAPTACSFTRTGNTATITWTAANNDGANRYVIERNRNNLGWSWAARINVGNPLTATNSVAAADSVQFRVKSRNAADDNSSYTNCNQVGGDGWSTQARWDFNATSGPIVDSVGNFDGSTGVGIHNGTVVRQGGSVSFDGNEGSIVVIPVNAGSSSFNSGGGKLRWITEFSMTAAQIQAAIDNQNNPNSPGTSWNLMQRGFALNSGGQWKTQIVVRGSGANQKAYVQCIVRDGQGDANGGSLLQRSLTAIEAGVQHRVQCEFDDAADRIQTTFDGNVEPWKDAPAAFGNVNVIGTTTCSGGNNQLGGAVTIGNKPACGTSPLTPDDPFQGTVYLAEVQKRS